MRVIFQHLAAPVDADVFVQKMAEVVIERTEEVLNYYGEVVGVDVSGEPTPEGSLYVWRGPTGLVWYDPANNEVGQGSAAEPEGLDAEQLVQVLSQTGDKGQAER